MSKYLSRKVCLGVVLLCTLSIHHVLAQDKMPAYTDIFRLAILSPPTTLDPQQTVLLQDHELRRHFFDPLFTLNNGEVFPILLESYRWKTPTRWEFTLKKGVLFHDGSELTSRDVMATFHRLARLKSELYVPIKTYQIRILDTYRFELESPQPDSELLWNLEDIVIIKHTAEQADSEGFNSGKHLIGTGPYHLLERNAFEAFSLEAFPDYHRGAAFIQKLIIRVETDSQQQMVDFLDGKADMISSVAAKKIPKLQQKANITNKTSHLLYHLSLDTWREQGLGVRDMEGRPLPHNPFKDLRVRQAISKALDRERLLFQLLGSNSRAQIAGQLINEHSLLYDPGLLPDKQDIREAKRLLKEAGYPEGFQMTIHDVEYRRYYLESIVPMLAQIGIKAKIVVLPVAEYFQGVDSRAFSAMFYFQGSGGNLAEILNILLHTDSKGNSGGYSNPLLDQQMDDAMAQISIDLKKRKLREAQRTAIADLGIIPILFRPEVWAIRQDMIFEPTDQLFTEAYYVRPRSGVK